MNDFRPAPHPTGRRGHPERCVADHHNRRCTPLCRVRLAAGCARAHALELHCVSPSPSVCAAADCASAPRTTTSYSENFGADRHCTADRPLTGYDTPSGLRPVAGAMPKVLRMLGQRRGCAIALVARLTQAITL
ncbi:hypothetical protein CERSUDRAFT_120360 [Gelatoporia subvermispora B]|uniref:Uncharacterized protein n=1 Tax=Ceriporiopsis subvermispora (strain B) TaxID=914234 RepID=M2QVU2_CERS8|nr:hypothetical protein CERSUDRAFT_120360 [Gelatoporia subvermispora B]